MAATLTFAGRQLAGTPESPRCAPPEAHVKTLKYWGTVGEGELNGFRGGRDITVPVVVHGKFSSIAALEAVLARADAMVGTVGTLQIINGDAGFRFTRPNCSFRGFAMDQGPEGGYVYSTTGNILGWWCRGVLLFRQLRDGN